MGKQTTRPECELQGLTKRQDPLNARFDPCSVPAIEAMPGVFAVFIIALRIVRTLTRSLDSPQWTNPFVEEPWQAKTDLPSNGKSHPAHANALFITSFLGLIFQLAAISYPRVVLQDISVILAWVCALIFFFGYANMPLGSR